MDITINKTVPVTPPTTVTLTLTEIEAVMVLRALGNIAPSVVIHEDDSAFYHSPHVVPSGLLYTLWEQLGDSMAQSTIVSQNPA